MTNNNNIGDKSDHLLTCATHENCEVMVTAKGDRHTDFLVDPDTNWYFCPRCKFEHYNHTTICIRCGWESGDDTDWAALPPQVRTRLEKGSDANQPTESTKPDELEAFYHGEEVAAGMTQPTLEELVLIVLVHGSTNDGLKASKQAIQSYIDSRIVEELNNILDNASGGGNWRRVIIQRMAELEKSHD